GRISRAEMPVRSPIDVSLAAPLLQCIKGDFAQAESEVIQLLQNNLSKLDNDNELFISFIDALFVLQRLDLVAAMLQDRYGFTKPLRLLIAKNGSGVGLVR